MSDLRCRVPFVVACGFFIPKEAAMFVFTALPVIKEKKVAALQQLTQKRQDKK